MTVTRGSSAFSPCLVANSCAHSAVDIGRLAVRRISSVIWRLFVPPMILFQSLDALGLRRAAAALLRLLGLPFRLVDRDHRVDGRDLRLQLGQFHR